MTTKRTSWLVVAALLITAAVRASAADPVNQDTAWTWDTYFSSFTSVTTKSHDIAGLGGAGDRALVPRSVSLLDPS